MNATIVNLTPHAVRIFNDAGEIIRVIEPTKPAARVVSEYRVVGNVDGIPVTEIDLGPIENLPPSQEGMIYIVSLLVQQAAANLSPLRSDLYRPDTSPQMVVRDAEGNILGVKALAQ